MKMKIFLPYSRAPSYRLSRREETEGRREGGRRRRSRRKAGRTRDTVFKYI